MKKLLLSIFSLLGVLGAAGATYTVDFNSAIDTDDPAFKVAPGWKHLVNTGAYAAQKVTYTYVADGDEDGAGCLQSSAQSYYDWWDSSDIPLYDLLVTPQVGGTVTLDVKKVSTTSGGIEFYKVIENGGQLTRGEKIEWTGESLMPMFFTTVTLNYVPEGTLIGIRADNVYIDNFTAEKANVVLAKELTITTSSPAKTGEIDCNSDNKFEIGGTVTFKNSGDLDIAPGDVSFSLAMMKPEGGNYVVDKVVGTFPINETIAMGATSSPIAFTALVNESDIEEIDGSKARRYDIICDVVPASRTFGNFTPVPYRPIPTYSTPKVSALEANGIIDLGIVTGSGSQVLTVSNDGAAEMTIQTVSVTGDGFSCTPTSNITIPKHESKDITIHLQSDVYGEKSGAITLSAVGLEPISFLLKGNVLDPDLWYVDFEDGQMPGNMVVEDGWSVSGSLATSPNKYYAVGANAQIPAKLISPLLTVGNGETISFEGARNYGDSYINVYTSTDRANWTKIRTLSPEAENDADKLTSEYTGTAWGSNTKYNFITFTLADLPSEPFYIAFEAGNARVDNILGGHIADVDHDIFISPVLAPANGMVNNEVTLKATVRNLMSQTESAADYQIALYSDDRILAEADKTDIEGNSAEEFLFVFTPHASGELPLKVVFTSDEYRSESSVYTINVAEELALQTKQVGNVTDKETSKTAPLNLYNSKSQSETVYTADLIGLTAGTKITKLVFKGKSGQTKNLDINLKVWLQNTEDATPAEILLDEEATAQMTSVYDGKNNFNVTKDEPTDLLVIELAEPFVYEGKNLRVAMDHNSTGWFTSYFELDKNVSGQSIVRASDSSLGAFSDCKLPVMYLDAAIDPAILKGNVTNTKGEPVKNAKVLIESGNVQYSATTDEDGDYSMTVFQSALEFSLTVTAEGYKSLSTGLLLEDPETVKDFILEEAETDGIQLFDNDTEDVYYNLQGIRLNEKPKNGMYIYKGKVYVTE